MLACSSCYASLPHGCSFLVHPCTTQTTWRHGIAHWFTSFQWTGQSCHQLEQMPSVLPVQVSGNKAEPMQDVLLEELPNLFLFLIADLQPKLLNFHPYCLGKVTEAALDWCWEVNTDRLQQRFLKIGHESSWLDWQTTICFMQQSECCVVYLSWFTTKKKVG